MNSPLQPLIATIIRHRLVLLVVSVVLIVAAWWPARNLELDRSIENMFPQGEPLLADYDRLKRTFGGNEVVLAVYSDEHLFATDGSGLRRVKWLRGQLADVPGIKGILSIDRPLGDAIVSVDSPIAARTRELFAGYTHDAAGQTAVLVCMLQPRGETSVDRETTVDAIRQVMQVDLPRQFPQLNAGMIAGEPVMVTDGFRFVEKDGQRLGIWTTALLAVVIILCFRSLRWVLVPLIVVQAALLWTQAALAMAGLRLSMVSSMLTAVVTVIGIATVIHLIVRFREARSDGLPPRDALLKAGVWLAAPIFWACCTDAVGFASLLVSRVGPVQDFGVMMAVGSLMVIVAVAMCTPGAALGTRVVNDPRRAWGERWLDVNLARTVMWADRHPWPIVAAAALVTAISAVGISRLEVETDFTKNFRDDSEIVQSYQFIENRLGGAGVWDVVLPAPDQLDWTYLRRVRRLEARLQAEVVSQQADGQHHPGISKTLSLADAVVAGLPQLETLEPGLISNTMVRGSLQGMRVQMPVFFDALYHADPQQPNQHWFRIMLRSRERQSAHDKKQLIEQARRIVAEEFPETANQPAGEVTGYFVLLTYLIDSLLADQWVAFGVACAGIFVMMLFALRDIRLAVIALVPNVVPIVVVTGFVGLLGWKVNMGAAMIAAVSVGLSVDSSIHYLTSFRRTRNEGRSLHASLLAVHHSVGRAMVFSTIALIVGFAALCVSEFIPTVYFGALVSLTMLGGLLGNLVVLPGLLRLTHRDVSASAGA